MKKEIKETMINVVLGLYALDKLQSIEELIDSTESNSISKNRLKEILNQEELLFKEDDLNEEQRFS